MTPSLPGTEPAVGGNNVTPVGRGRLNSIDCLRGLIMVIMALDHTRDYLAAGTGNLLRDVHHPALFLTRWITHYCAPNFVFLAGVSAFLYGTLSSNKSRLRWFLLTRGTWLVLCELTLVRIGWSFSFVPDFFVLQVIWAIGCSMIFFGGVLSLPRGVLVALAIVLIGAHNLLDGVSAAAWGRFTPVWLILHQQGLFQIGAHIRVFALYPLIPWIGVLLGGYLCGPIFLYEPQRRRRTLWLAGGLVVVFFLALRGSNWYGDPSPWHSQNELWSSALSFINCEKYPPSLLFLAMTIGPALLALVALDQVRGRSARFFITFGRVPFFFYLLHIYLIHAVALGLACIDEGWTAWRAPAFPPPANRWNFGLLAVYAFWIGIVLILYPLCRWYARVKQTRRDWWLSYL